MSKIFKIKSDVVLPAGTVLTEGADMLTGSADVGNGGSISVTIPVNADNSADLVTEDEAPVEAQS